MKNFTILLFVLLCVVYTANSASVVAVEESAAKLYVAEESADNFSMRMLRKKRLEAGEDGEDDGTEEVDDADDEETDAAGGK